MEDVREVLERVADASYTSERTLRRIKMNFQSKSKKSKRLLQVEELTQSNLTLQTTKNMYQFLQTHL